MDSEDKFWLYWSMMAITALCFLIGCVTYSCNRKDSKIAAMVEAGADPIEAKMALASVDNSNMLIMLISNRKADKP